MAAACVDDRLYELGRCAVGAIGRSTRAIAQALGAFPQVPIDPLVASLAADTVVVTQLDDGDSAPQDRQ